MKALSKYCCLQQAATILEMRVHFKHALIVHVAIKEVDKSWIFNIEPYYFQLFD
jgi:hypothetical protein